MWLIPFKANDERICIVFVASAIRIQELESNSAAGFEKPRSRGKTAPNTDINYWYYRISKKWIILSGSELFYRILLLICAENFIQNKNLKK